MVVPSGAYLPVQNYEFDKSSADFVYILILQLYPTVLRIAYSSLLLLFLAPSSSESKPKVAAALASSSLFRLLCDPEGATPVRSFSASSDVKLIKVV
jgi:hypothetical protein